MGVTGGLRLLITLFARLVILPFALFGAFAQFMTDREKRQEAEKNRQAEERRLMSKISKDAEPDEALIATSSHRPIQNVAATALSAPNSIFRHTRTRGTRNAPRPTD